jgi:hypothetical protein
VGDMRLQMVTRPHLLLGIVALAAPLFLLPDTPSRGQGFVSDAGQAVASASAASIPVGLPDHLGIGLMNGPLQLSWMTASGIPWDYRYQYLTGGVNTGEGWTTWNDPPGSFADIYLQDSGANGYIPVLTYYQVVPSAPDPWGEDVSIKLQNASTMQAYYAEWKLLMQKAGAYGNPVVVHVEPDLWGYMQQGYGNNANNVPVKVAASGFGEVAGYPNTAAGFARALIHLRDVYAPNVVLGYHFSHWATGEDLIINDADPIAIADQLWAFYQSLGANFDLIFFDPTDRDAAYYQLWDGGAHWWDDADYTRYRTFVGRLVEKTGKWAVLWQVPIGNTLYRSQNNSWGHYQDNHVQNWVGDRQHLLDYVDAGVMAIMYGAGAYGMSMYTDEMGDGITNPAPINGNNLVAQYADDDGGYLRLKAAQYYQEGPIDLSGSPPEGNDSDHDGCTDYEEAFGAPPPKPGSTCSSPASCYSDSNWYDFYDVPTPVNPDMTPNGSKNRSVTLTDVLAVLFYVGTKDGGPPNARGVDYDSVKGSCDANGDTVADEEGLCYDRTASLEPSPPWNAGPPNGAITIGDVLTQVAQVGLDCSGSP